MRLRNLLIPVLLIGFALTTTSHAQINSVDQLADLVVQSFQKTAVGQRRVVVRDFRTPGSIELGLTDAVKSKLTDYGIKPSLMADYEIEGRIKRSLDYRGFETYLLKLTIVNPEGYDRDMQFSLAPGLINLSNETSEGGTTPKPSDGSNEQPGDGIKIPESKPKKPSGRHQIYPDEEWKVYELKRGSLRHVKKGFITNRGDWQTFWAMTKLEIPLPNVDFEKQIIRIEAVPYPRTINAEIFSAGNGNIDITKDISNEPAAANGLINAHVLIINKSDITQKRKIRLGVTVDATYDNIGVIVTSVVDGAPITQGKMDDGRAVALEPGDVILSLDGISTNSVGGFAKLVKDSNGILRAEVKNVKNGEIIYVTFMLN